MKLPIVNFAQLFECIYLKNIETYFFIYLIRETLLCITYLKCKLLRTNKKNIQENFFNAGTFRKCYFVNKY